MTGPLHRPVDTRTLPVNGYDETIVADEGERAALATANGIEAVEALSASIRVRDWNGEGVRVTGKLEAKVTQACSVTLEPVRSTIDEPIDAVFVPEGSNVDFLGSDGEILIDAEGEDAPESFHPPMLEVGAVVAEFLTLSLDPYPRAEGAELPSAASDPAASPFAGLAKLKDRSE